MYIYNLSMQSSLTEIWLSKGFKTEDNCTKYTTGYNFVYLCSKWPNTFLHDRNSSKIVLCFRLLLSSLIVFWSLYQS